MAKIRPPPTTRLVSAHESHLCVPEHWQDNDAALLTGLEWDTIRGSIAQKPPAGSLQKLHRSAGASLVEYALLIGLAGTIGILAIRSLGQTVSQQFSSATGIIVGNGP